eukprot:1160599-Pelagomonas_calceolata.AAC.7
MEGQQGEGGFADCLDACWNFCSGQDLEEVECFTLGRFFEQAPVGQKTICNSIAVKLSIVDGILFSKQCFLGSTTPCKWRYFGGACARPKNNPWVALLKRTWLLRGTQAVRLSILKLPWTSETSEMRWVTSHTSMLVRMSPKTMSSVI